MMLKNDLDDRISAVEKWLERQNQRDFGQAGRSWRTRPLRSAVLYETPKTIRPDLIGKTIVHIVDPRPHGDGRIPPMIAIGQIVAAEEDYARMRWTKTHDGRPASKLLDLTTSLEPCYDEYEPGKKLDEYLPGYSALVGTPDYVLNSYERDRAQVRESDDGGVSRRTTTG